MAKKVSKWFRIGVEGDTCDGRVISADDIQEMADTFDPRVYGCRINLEHIKSLIPDSPFKRYGDVTALKAEIISDDSALNGKKALFAKIAPLDELVSMVRAGQKVYTSMEIRPNFSNSGKCYLIGLAVTDDPASLGTEYLEFCSRAILSRLQAPTGKAFEAIKELGVKTSDDRGNTRPIFSILKEMQRSFEKNNLGTSQRGEYMKTIFGEEASSAAAVLMTAASTGKLDKLTAAFKASDGKTEELVKIMQDNLGGDFKEFQSAYEAVGTDLFDQQNDALRKLTQTATRYVLKLDGWITRNKSLATTIGVVAGGALALIGVIGGIGLIAWPVVMGINAIIAAAGLLGTVFTVAGGAIVTAVGAISLPVVAVAGAVVAGALLIRKYWEPISAFFSGVVEGLKAAFAPVAEIFSPLTPVFDSIIEKLRGVWQWFTDLIAPVKATQETLDRCKNVGVAFGKALADALTAPLNVFNSLSGKVGWLLEKLGVIKKESDGLDQTAAKASAAAGTQNGSYIPQTSVYGGYQMYQPVTAPAGRSYVDQSKREYNITLSGGVAPGTDLDRQLREAVEKLDREERARQRSSMRHDG